LEGKGIRAILEDEVFLRTDASGARSFLVDRLGTTLALADSSGALQTQYSYDPFGQTTTTGPSSANAQQYAGRENDGTGLYFYRGRYYSPALKRFIAEDPIDVAGGLNLYAYVNDDPINLIDPSGFSSSPGRENYNSCSAGGQFICDTEGNRIGLGHTPGAAVPLADDPVFFAAGLFAAGFGGAAETTATVASTGGDVLPATFVRTIAHGERIAALEAELAERTYVSGGLEHAIISLQSGERVIVSGGTGGIQFGSDLQWVPMHTHPTTTGPSAIDFIMLEQTGQRHSYIYELFGGGRTRFDRR